jgi:hypothetical protein
LFLVLFVVFLYLFLVTRRVRVNLRLDALVDVAQTDQVQSVVPLAIVEGLFWFVSHPFHSLLHFVQILLSLHILILEGVPVEEMPPEPFPIMETVAFLKGNFVTAQVVICNVLHSFGLGYFHVLVCKVQGGVVDEGPHPLADFRHVLVDVPAVDGLEQVLQVLDNFKDIEDDIFSILILSGNLVHVNLEISVLGVPGFMDEEFKRMEYFLKGKIDVACQICVPHRVFDLDHVVVWSIADQFSDLQQLILDDRHISKDKGFEQQTIPFSTLEVVQFVEVRPQMSHHHPTTVSFSQDSVKELDGMHVFCFTDVDHILILDESTEYLEEGGHVEEFRGHF